MKEETQNVDGYFFDSVANYLRRIIANYSDRIEDIKCSSLPNAHFLCMFVRSEGSRCDVLLSPLDGAYPNARVHALM